MSRPRRKDHCMKRIALRMILLCLGVLLMLVGCTGGNGDDPKKTTATPTTETPTTEAPPPSEPAFSLESLTLNGTDISQYTIVYARSPYYGVEQTYGGKIPEGELNPDQRTAERLSELIKNYFGVEIPIVEDRSTSTYLEHEILIGKTNRPQTSTVAVRMQSERVFTLKMVDKKLIACGGSFGATWHAIDALENRFAAALAAEESTEVAVASGEDLSGNAPVKVVACVGDSITFGDTSTEPAEFSYPATMGRMLWKDYVVFNYGQSGRTLCENTSYPYSASPQYAQCIANKISYDLVIIILGTNDAGLASWGSAQEADFLNSADRLVGAIQQKNPNAKFVFATCPYKRDAGAIANVRELQRRVVTDLRADGVDIDLFDFHRYSEVEMGTAMFPDGVHPDDAGYAKLAQGVIEVVRAVFEGGSSQYFTPTLTSVDQND